LGNAGFACYRMSAKELRVATQQKLDRLAPVIQFKNNGIVDWLTDTLELAADKRL
jgi:hypothetical protein